MRQEFQESCLICIINPVIDKLQQQGTILTYNLNL